MGKRVTPYKKDARGIGPSWRRCGSTQRGPARKQPDVRLRPEISRREGEPAFAEERNKKRGKRRGEKAGTAVASGGSTAAAEGKGGLDSLEEG